MSTPGNKAYAKEFFISPELDNPCIYIDVSDLVEYIHHNIKYSGIQRVVAQLLKYAYYNRSNRVFPVVPCNGTSNFNVYPLERLIEILSAIEEGNTTRTKLDDALDEIGNITTTVSPQPGDIYFMPGAFWTYDSHDFLMDLKTIGVSFVFFVHDLIQIVNPEYVHESANRKFLVSFVNAVSVADNIITNSNYVADDVSKFIEDRLSASLPNKVPVYAAPLATELPIIKTKSASQVSAEIRRVTATPYVLCVGTMEIRKNNLYLVKVWEKLRSSIGSEMVPNIIYVGKKGWHNDHFFDYIENCGYLDNWVYLMEKISDVDLSYLYDKCAFTAYVSFAEGYGLPISESFAHGKLCVTSNVTSMPEVGSNFAAYVNPYDVRSGIDVIGSLIKNSDLIKAAEKKIIEQFKVKTWADFSMQVFDLLDKNIDCEVKKIFCRIPSGEITAVGDEDLLQMDARKHSLINSRMARTSGWHQIEGWGCWAAKREARIQFLSDLMAGQKIRLYLDLTLPMDLQSAQLIINTHEIKNQEIYINKKQSWYTCDAVVSEHGEIDLSIISVGKSFPTDARGTLYFGLRQLGYCLYDNASSRVDFLEKVGSVMKACTPIIVDKTPEKDNYPVLLMQKMLFQNAAFFVASSLDEPDITLFNVGIYRWFLHIYNLRMARQSSRRKNWKKGARYYACLIRNGTMTGKTWVQFGHMLNEQGMLMAAAAAYSAGFYFLPNDSDARWHHENSLRRMDSEDDYLALL